MKATARELRQDQPQRQPDRPAPAVNSVQQILALQRGAGNAAVSRALRPQIMRFDAAGGGHQGMERDVAGLDPHGGLANPTRLGEKDPAAGTREAGVNAVYSGNFMQDFSQINTPMFLGTMSKLPKDPMGDPKGKAIGMGGAEAISTSLIRALAILEVGPRLANSVVAGNMQQYRPEQHVDQPIGYSAATDTVVRDSKSGDLRPGRRAVEGGVKPGQKIGRGPVDTVDKDRDRELAGSAVPGIQVENPELFKASPAGLQNHIYNSSEWVKNHWLQAAQQGPNDLGRFHLGAGMHAIEDYFAHSNFIEVGLNSYIESALAKGKPSAAVKQLAAGGRTGAQKSFVDTLYDAKVPSAGKRQVVTTASVGPMDMRASIGHILLPKVPELQGAINTTIDKAFHLVEDNKVSHWNDLKKTFAEDRPAAAVLALGEGVDKAGMTLPVPVGIDVDWDELDTPGPNFIKYPTDVSIEYEDQPMTAAISSYLGYVKSVKTWINRIQDLLDWLKYIPAAWLAREAAKKVLAALKEAISSALQDLKEKIKRQLALLIVQLIDTITGVDVPDQKNRTIGDALHGAHEAIEDLETQTSLQYRLLPGGDLAGLSKEELEPVVGPVTPSPTGGWVAVNPLPPSHSEISKDHAPHQKSLVQHAKDPAKLHDAEQGSVFYGIARALAVEADRHVLRQAELMWASSGSLYGDGKALETSKMTVGHDAFVKEAGARGQAEGKRAAKQGFKHAQSDAAQAALLAKRPEVKQLLDIVDVIIAHPEDSTWWRPVMDGYVNDHAPEVAEHIRARNATRANRRRVGS
jgi:hypothetical protein